MVFSTPQTYTKNGILDGVEVRGGTGQVFVATLPGRVIHVV
jgi:hypothetical protein